MKNKKNKKKKIIYLVTEDWYFYSHRLSLACAAKKKGYDVVAITKVNKYGKQIEEKGVKLIDLDFKRKEKGIFESIKLIKKIYSIYKKEAPDIVHHVSLKTVVIGSIAAFFARVPKVINALTGLGFIFTSNKLIVKIIKIILIEPALKFLLHRKNTWTIVQNIDDKKLLRSFDILTEGNTVLIRGSGVDLSKFIETSENNEIPCVVFASRMLIDKGINEFIRAVKILKKENISARFVLVGNVDEGNPSSLTENELKSLDEKGLLEWWGYKQNMNDVFMESHIVCLPSHREGLPKVLLEAAAASRPIVASDVPGCREIVHHGNNGLLVPVKDSNALAEALKKLILNKKLRDKMGKDGRKIVESEYAIEIINEQTLDLYEKVLDTA